MNIPKQAARRLNQGGNDEVLQGKNVPLVGIGSYLVNATDERLGR